MAKVDGAPRWRMACVALAMLWSPGDANVESRAQPPAGPSTCGCPLMRNAVNGADARMFAGGAPGVDHLLVEDAATHDVYRYGPGNTWTRIGGAARAYALRTNVYRLAGDGYAEIARDDGDNWTRFGASRVASDILTYLGHVYTPRAANPSVPVSVLVRWDAAVDTMVDNVPVASGVPRYAGNDSGLYRSLPAGISRYSGTPGVWTVLGPHVATNMYAAAGTVFVVSGARTLRYLGTGTSWQDVGPAVERIAGTTTAAWALSAGNVARFDPASGSWTTVRRGGDVRDIAAGGVHLFALTTAGSVLRLEATGPWTDLSCKGPVSVAGCVNGCDPGPAPTLTSPTYTDPEWKIQVDPANLRYGVLTQHNNIARTGAVRHEDVLTPASLATGNFGLLGRVAVKGRIYAQPLYVEKAAVMCDGRLQSRDVAFVATLENRVYAIDVGSRTICWETPCLGCPQVAYGPGCFDGAADGACNANFNMSSGTSEVAQNVRVGIVSTPVIDPARSVMYVVTRVRGGSEARGRYFLQVLDTRTGQLVARVETIADTLNGRDDCNGKPFHPSLGTQRAGLLLVNNTVFVAFSGNAGEASDIDYYGHVLGFDVSNPARPVNLTRSFCATPNPTSDPGSGHLREARGGGIWMAGGGIASDGTNAFFTTSNSAYDFVGGSYVLSQIPEAPVAGNWPSSFVKLGMDMRASGYTDTRKVGAPGETNRDKVLYSWPLPSNHPKLDGHSMFWGRERSDADFGSGGVLILDNRLIGAGKDGRLYVIDTTTMSRVQDFQAFVDIFHGEKTYDFLTSWYAGPHLHGGPAAFDARPNAPYIYVYAWAEKDRLKRFRFDPSANKFLDADAVDAFPGQPFPTAHGDLSASAPMGMPGGMLSVSSNGTNDGIVWATVQEPYKFCNRVATPAGLKVLVDQPVGRGTPFHGCDVQGGYVPGRLFAFSTDVDRTTPAGASRLKLLWGDTSAVGEAIPAFPGVTPLPNNFIPAYAKHVPPTIAHGRVLVATANDELLIYGLGSANARPRHNPAFAMRTDGIALSGGAGWPGINLAQSRGDGSFAASEQTDAAFASWAATANVARLAGDFNGDGRTDIALVGGAGWTQAKVAFFDSSGASAFQIRQGAAPNFLFWATSPAAARLVGDFNGDGRADIALTGEPSWHTVPIAFSNGDASFAVLNPEASTFAGWATSPAATKLVGDFDGNGKADIALVGDPSWHTIPTAFSNGDALAVTNGEVGGFGGWAAGARQRLVGDFNGDGRDDIALVGNADWHTIPIAFADGHGQFRISNEEVGQFAVWAAGPGVTRLAADFNGDGRTDIALVNVSTSLTAATLPIAFANGDGSFRVTEMSFPDGGFRTWAAGANVQAIAGDFNRDGYADVALTGGAGWVTIPCALSKGDGTFLVFNAAGGLDAFAVRSAAAGANATLRLGGSYRR